MEDPSCIWYLKVGGFCMHDISDPLGFVLCDRHFKCGYTTKITAEEIHCKKNKEKKPFKPFTFRMIRSMRKVYEQRYSIKRKLF